MDQDRMAAEPSIEGQPFFEPMAVDEGIKSESVTNSPLLPTLADQLPAFKSSSAPLPSTEIPDPAESAESAAPMPAQPTSLKKKGMASSIKKAPKRSKSGGDSKKTKKAKSAAPGPGTPAAEEASDEDDESDSGPYCICRGPDDHRWMICCEKCEDWFHGECVHIGKDVGENLIEKFICPNCTNEDVMTIYKKTCALQGCRKAARLTQTPASVFCTNEHAQTWWERMLARLPRIKSKAALSDELSQEEFMALLNSGLAGIDGDGAWKLKAPFSEKLLPNGTSGDANGTDERLAQILTDEEVECLDSMAKARFRLAEETVLCHKMISLIEMVQERRRAAINAGRFTEDICGYDQRLDTICARDAFAAFLTTSQGETIFQTSKVDDPLGEGDEIRGMCERKRCKVHSGWQKILVLGIRHQIREMAVQAEEVGEEERIVRDAAGERWKRRQAERNWVEVIEG
ncbi:Set1 complex component spp1-like protein [Cladobotryum mycophilum]|uniref:Set1 complex component spp1-like protein n=1 Tax=Cladobotryum mycophilum TaxID=491253 RepID=A0ABR0SHQ7_9HYPO